MKFVVLIICCLFATPAISQTNEIYRLTFSDISNLDITKSPGQKRPNKFVVLATSGRWNPQRFWLENVDLKSPAVLADLERTEHHPYHFAYLFGKYNRDLDSLINDKEKMALSKKAKLTVPKKLSLPAGNYIVAPSRKNLTGFFVDTTEPIFTSDGKYAFIDLTVFFKESVTTPLNESYYGTVCVVFKKQKDNSWKKVDTIRRLIL